MTREEAYQIVTTFIKTPNLIKHHLAAEAAMKGLAEYFILKGNSEVDIDDWGLVGLLHDADYELTKENVSKHTLVLEENIGDKIKPEIMYAIKSHAYHLNGVEPKSLMDWSIYTCDELTGFIIAVALVKPDKKLVGVDVKSVLKRLKEPAFARSVDRSLIKACEEKLQIPLPEFTEIVLASMQGISNKLGL